MQLRGQAPDDDPGAAARPRCSLRCSTGPWTPRFSRPCSSRRPGRPNSTDARGARRRPAFPRARKGAARGAVRRLVQGECEPTLTVVCVLALLGGGWGLSSGLKGGRGRLRPFGRRAGCGAMWGSEGWRGTPGGALGMRPSRDANVCCPSVLWARRIAAGSGSASRRSLEIPARARRPRGPSRQLARILHNCPTKKWRVQLSPPRRHPKCESPFCS